MCQFSTQNSLNARCLFLYEIFSLHTFHSAWLLIPYTDHRLIENYAICPDWNCAVFCLSSISLLLVEKERKSISMEQYSLDLNAQTSTIWHTFSVVFHFIHIHIHITFYTTTTRCYFVVFVLANYRNNCAHCILSFLHGEAMDRKKKPIILSTFLYFLLLLLLLFSISFSLTALCVSGWVLKSQFKWNLKLKCICLTVSLSLPLCVALIY